MDRESGICIEDRRAQLGAQFGLTELFIDVSRFCAITGFSTSTVYEQIRQRRFFLPITKMGRKPYVAVDDFLNWYCGRSDAADRGTRV